MKYQLYALNKASKNKVISLTGVASFLAIFHFQLYLEKQMEVLQLFQELEREHTFRHTAYSYA